MAKPGDTIHIPLKEPEALRGLMAVKPTADMPRPGASQTKRKGSKKLASRKADK